MSRQPVGRQGDQPREFFQFNYHEYTSSFNMFSLAKGGCIVGAKISKPIRYFCGRTIAER
jgi:hypothetical protein